jgi:hypothetical protein
MNFLKMCAVPEMVIFCNSALERLPYSCHDLVALPVAPVVIAIIFAFTFTCFTLHIVHYLFQNLSTSLFSTFLTDGMETPVSKQFWPKVRVSGTLRGMVLSAVIC